MKEKRPDFNKPQNDRIIVENMRRNTCKEPLYPIRLNKTTVVYVIKRKHTPEYAEALRKKYNL